MRFERITVDAAQMVNKAYEPSWENVLTAATNIRRFAQPHCFSRLNSRYLKRLSDHFIFNSGYLSQ